MSGKVTEKLEISLAIFVLIAMVLILFFNGDGLVLVTNLFTKVFTSMALSIAVAALVSALVGSFLLDFGNMNIGGIKLNIPTLILVFLIKLWLV